MGMSSLHNLRKRGQWGWKLSRTPETWHLASALVSSCVPSLLILCSPLIRHSPSCHNRWLAICSRLTVSFYLRALGHSVLSTGKALQLPCTWTIPTFPSRLSSSSLPQEDFPNTHLSLKVHHDHKRTPKTALMRDSTLNLSTCFSPCPKIVIHEIIGTLCHLYVLKICLKTEWMIIAHSDIRSFVHSRTGFSQYRALCKPQ